MEYLNSYQAIKATQTLCYFMGIYNNIIIKEKAPWIIVIDAKKP